MGYQTGIPQTDHRLLETVLLDQDDNLSADPDERATGYQAELRLETQWPEHNRENFDHNQTVTLERPIHHQVSDCPCVATLENSSSRWTIPKLLFNCAELTRDRKFLSIINGSNGNRKRSGTKRFRASSFSFILAQPDPCHKLLTGM